MRLVVNPEVEARMYSTSTGNAELDQAELYQKVQKLETRYRETSLQLDLARLEYYQLRRDAGAPPAEVARAEEKVFELIDKRDALHAELERLENFH